MPKGMLGTLSLRRVRGPKGALDDLLAADDGEEALTELKKFVKRQPCWGPSMFEYNEHGHLMLTVRGLGLDGAKELELLRAAGYAPKERADSYAQHALERHLSNGGHILEPGKDYYIAIVPGADIPCKETSNDKSDFSCVEAAVDNFGYKKLPAGIMPRLRHQLMPFQVERIIGTGRYGLSGSKIAGFHDPFPLSEQQLVVLAIGVHTYCGGGPDFYDNMFTCLNVNRESWWNRLDVAFAFGCEPPPREDPREAFFKKIGATRLW
ncbi:hypothetical protein HY971_00960 [Candidatus Kaiserbacteria bacterium]|nr:hypothetical protein [Candidatus Kaiserbacteria bacterium]